MYISNDGDKDVQMSVVVDRGQGGSSVTDGTIEVMVNRWIGEKLSDHCAKSMFYALYTVYGTGIDRVLHSTYRKMFLENFTLKVFTLAIQHSAV